mmetsp:Transcript_6282/g.10418  ORF Transcript_6282/g.10418 Transcript_6282/m.10418 type:complete len:221 (-) Transcript_6282:115-777(-)
MEFNVALQHSMHSFFPIISEFQAIFSDPLLDEGQRNGSRNSATTSTSAAGRERKKRKKTPQQKLKDAEIRGNKLQNKIAAISDRRRGIVATVAAHLWVLKLKKELATSRHFVERVIQCAKEAKKYVQEAGLLEQTAERIIWDIDEVLSHGDIEMRRRRKALVLRTKSFMKQAAMCTRPLKWVQKVDVLIGKITKSTQFRSSSSNMTVLVELLRLILRDDH